MHEDQIKICLAECNCTEETMKDHHCCFLECNYRLMNIIGKTLHFEGINVEGLKISYLLSVRSKIKLEFKEKKLIIL